MDGMLMPPTGAESGGDKLAWQMVDDQGIAAKIKLAAPDAKPGDQAAIDAFKTATQGLDFKGTDGTFGTYAGKSLVDNGGGKAAYLRDMLEVGGKSQADVQHITMGTFVNSVKADIPGDGPISAKIAQWKVEHPKPVAGPTSAT
jgi:hypothetical protein